jgi:hypothetical protein
LDDFPGNSKLPRGPEPEKSEERQVERIVTTPVIQRKKSFFHKVKDVFFGGDFKTAAKYVAGDVLLPMFRDMLFQTVISSAERSIYPDAYGRRPPPLGSRVRYNSMPERRYPPDPRDRWDPRGRIPDQSSRRTYRVNTRDSDEIIIGSRAEAERVVEDMFKDLEKYQVVTWGSVKEMLGLETSYIDQKWGWTYLHNVNIRQVREGYLIDLPPMEEV